MIYGNKHVVFEQVVVETNTYVWNASNNKDNDNCINNYQISNIRDTLSSTILPKLSNELTSELVSTTVQTAKNGNSATLISTDDKLFLEAGKEVGYTTYGRTEENNALTTWQYWTTHTSSSDHIKYQEGTSTAKQWWLRSPKSGTTGIVRYIADNGSPYSNDAYVEYGISSCFAW